MDSNREALMAAVRRLSSSGGVVLRTGERPDALALGFDETYAVYTETLVELPSEELLRALQALDSGLQALSDPTDAALWNARDFDSHPRWVELRKLADAVLAQFAKPSTR